MPARRTDAKGYRRARELRRNATPAERKLWAALCRKQLGVKFRRQHAIGPYIADFCCVKHKLIIEVDGSQHLDQADYDAARTEFLASKGYRVLRFWNHEVMKNLDEVIRLIQDALETDPP